MDHSDENAPKEEGSGAPQVPSPGEPRCAACAAAGARQRCTRCWRVVYCSRGCQKRDWDAHRGPCALTAEKAASLAQSIINAAAGIVVGYEKALYRVCVEELGTYSAGGEWGPMIAELQIEAINMMYFGIARGEESFYTQMFRDMRAKLDHSYVCLLHLTYAAVKEIHAGIDECAGLLTKRGRDLVGIGAAHRRQQVAAGPHVARHKTARKLPVA